MASFFASDMKLWLAQISDVLEGKPEAWLNEFSGKLVTGGFSTPRDLVTLDSGEHLLPMGFELEDADVILTQAEMDFAAQYLSSAARPQVLLDMTEVTFQEGPLKINFKGIHSGVEGSDIIVVASFDNDTGVGPAEASGKISPLDVLEEVNGLQLKNLEFQDSMRQIQGMQYPKTLKFARRHVNAADAQAAAAASAEEAATPTGFSPGAAGGGGGPTFDDNTTQMEGWLEKQGHLNKAWKRRYFVLKTGQLEYYTDEPSNPNATLQGRIPLANSTLYSLPEPHSFVVQSLNSATGSKKAFPMRAVNDASRECWVELCRLHGSDAVMTGWLTKQGHLVPSWKRRWFVLEPPSKLHYFTAPAGEFKGTIVLAGARVESNPNKAKEFHIHTLAGSDKDFQLRTDSAPERDAWMRHCRNCASGLTSPPDGDTPVDEDEIEGEDAAASPVPQTTPTSSSSRSSKLLTSFFRSKPRQTAATSAAGAGATDLELRVDVSLADFQLKKVVGKGAFGKVMMCQKRTGEDAGEIYAVKVLIKSVIAEKKQVEHTKSERRILMEISHPFIVRLRYAFQSEEKLYLVTDYYNGGSLFYHLRKSRSFPEDRARFYGAEIMLAIEHLHQHGIIYRDLKLENILMDHLGHIALTDFGLSKENVDQVFSEQLKTFCGTAEYIAPELLKGFRYGAAVDWWSFGILLYEMLNLKTPFYDKNRKLMFHSIINQNPKMPRDFSPEAKDIIKEFLNKDAKQRLGCAEGAAQEIMSHAFFAPIDFDLLVRKELEPPFRPDVSDKEDTKYVPSAYLKLEAKDSLVKPNPGAASGKGTQWDGFSYATPNPTGGAAGGAAAASTE